MVGLITFDTLSFARKMEEAGMDSPLAEALASAHAEIMTDSLATKDDLILYYQQAESRLKELDEKRDGQFADINARFAEIDARFARIDERFAEIDVRFAKIDARLQAMDTKIDNLSKELHTKIDTVARDLTIQIQTAQKDTILRLGSLIVVLFGVFFGLMRFFPVG